MSLDPTTIATYNNSAEDFAEHFKQYKESSEPKEITLVFQLAGNPSAAQVTEIGCGAGKDALHIIKRTPHYEGFDPSKRLLAIAQRQVPQGSFVESDALGYDFRPHQDIVLAVASMLHLNRDDFRIVCQKVLKSLRPDGVFYLALKESDQYIEQWQEDDFGKRLFYLYTPALVCDLAGAGFEVIHEEHYTAGPRRKPWFTLMLRKK